MNRTSHHVLTLTALLLSSAGAALAQQPDQGRTLGGLVGASDLVFEGKVVNIEYALSDPSGAEGSRTPYTFVTYSVDQVFFGSVETAEITLRFIGGLNPVTMRYMSSSITPQFDLSDRDILFVQGNGERLCPLAGNLEGRYRLIGEQVYTESGRAVTLGDKGEVRIGARFNLEEWQTTTVQGRVFISTADDVSLELPSTATSAESLRIALTKQTAGKRPVNAFVNTSIEEPLPGPDLTPAAPPVAKPGEAAPVPASVDPTTPEPKG